MTRRLSLPGPLCLAALAAIVAVAAVAIAQERPVFRTGVDLVRLDALVTDGSRPIGGLTAADFEVRDQGVMQKVQVATQAGDVSVALALDTSGSLEEGRLDGLVRAIEALMNLLAPADTVSLVTFSDRLVVRADSTRDITIVRAALQQAAPSGMTAVWDGLFAGLSLGRGGADRSLVLLFTDGLENASWLSEQQITESVKRSQAVIYAVRPPEPPGKVSVGQAGYLEPARRRLQQVVGHSGGSVLDTDSDGRLPARFVGVLNEFRSRYLITYEPTGVGRDDGWHRVEVRVRGRQAKIQVRPGYYANPR